MRLMSHCCQQRRNLMWRRINNSNAGPNAATLQTLFVVANQSSSQMYCSKGSGLGQSERRTDMKDVIGNVVRAIVPISRGRVHAKAPVNSAQHSLLVPWALLALPP